MNKPTTDIVMREIIQQIRIEFPFHLGEAELCTDTCTVGCPLKLLEYMEQEVIEWEQRLDNGDIPDFRDIQNMTKVGKKIHHVLEQNKLIESE